MDIYQETTKFYQSFQGEKRVIGKSLCGRNIYAVKIGAGAPTGIAQYALHGREFITAKLAFLHAKMGLNKGSFWIIPLANPDGALLSQIGLSAISSEKRKKRLLALNGGNKDFSLWKANARGVDLNVNFPADWATGVKNVFARGAENCVGDFPCSESETLALKAFTEEISPDYTVSFHTKGEEIYWRYGQSGELLRRDRRLASVLSKATGYPLKETFGSVGGYKDWCIQTLGIPAFTVEVGKDEWAHPLGANALQDIAEKNRFAVYDLSGRI